MHPDNKNCSKQSVRAHKLFRLRTMSDLNETTIYDAASDAYVDEYMTSYNSIFVAGAAVSAALQIVIWGILARRFLQKSLILQQRVPVFGYICLAFGCLASTIGTGIAAKVESGSCAIFAWTSSIGIAFVLSALVERSVLLFFWGKEIVYTLLDEMPERKPEAVLKRISNWSSFSVVIPAVFLSIVFLILFSVGYPNSASVDSAFFTNSCQSEGLKRLLLMQWVTALFVVGLMAYRIRSSHNESNLVIWPMLRRELIVASVMLLISGIYHVVYGSGGFQNGKPVLVTFFIFGIIFYAIFVGVLGGLLLRWDQTIVKAPENLYVVRVSKDKPVEEKKEFEEKKDAPAVVPVSIEPEFPPVEQQKKEEALQSPSAPDVEEKKDAAVAAPPVDTEAPPSAPPMRQESEGPPPSPGIQQENSNPGAQPPAYSPPGEL
jgi:hypothetical protein